MNVVARKSWALLPAELQILILEIALLDDREERDPLLKYYPPNCPPLVLQSLQFLTPLERSWELSTRREELKKARLINSVFCRLLTPVVFATLHISRNTLSIERAKAIASSPLAYHVREIVVHQGGWWHLETHLPLQGPSYSTFLQRVNSHRYRNDYPKDIHPKRAEKGLHKSYIEEIESERQLQQNDISEFGTLMASLPNLNAFTVLPYKMEFNDVETSWYTLKRCGLSYLPEDNIGYEWVCQLANAIQPKALNCSSIGYDVFVDLIKRSLKRASPAPSGSVKDPVNAFHTLDYLTFHVIESPINHEMWPIYKMFPNIETMVLQLGLGGARAWTRPDPWGSLIPTAINSVLLSRLARFELDIGCAMKLQDMCSLVLKFQSTLRHLALRNTGSAETRGHGPNSSHACIEESLLRVLYRIYQETSLESCIIDESCHDVKDWDLNGEPAPYLARRPDVGRPKFAPLRRWPGLENKKRIMAKVSEAMCRRREWPFSLNIDLDFGVRRDSVQEPAARFCLVPWEETTDIFDNLDAPYPELI